MKETYPAIYTVNVVFQAIFTLLWQIGLGLLCGYLLVTFAHTPEWVYIPAVLIGVITGFGSMIKFILGAMRSLDRIEAERRERLRAKRKKEQENGTENE